VVCQTRYGFVFYSVWKSLFTRKTNCKKKTTTYDLLGKRILVVEDNAMDQMVIKMILKNEMVEEKFGL
jgi:PleD family two-component response regulator